MKTPNLSFNYEVEDLLNVSQTVTLKTPRSIGYNFGFRGACKLVGKTCI